MIDRKELISFRQYKESDKNLIMASWLNGLHFGNSFFREIPRKEFLHHYGQHVQRILDRPGCIVIVACLRAHPDVILGYSVTEEIEGKSVLHWVFVKQDWRRIGIAKDILPKRLDVFTHQTKASKLIKQKDTVFNPFL